MRFQYAKPYSGLQPACYNLIGEKSTTVGATDSAQKSTSIIEGLCATEVVLLTNANIFHFSI